LRIVPPFRIKGIIDRKTRQSRRKCVGAWRLYQLLVSHDREIDKMNKNTSFSLGDHFADFVESQVAHGRYSSVSEVVRAGLRLLEDQEAQLSALRAALIDGETSGVSTSFDFDAFVARKRREPSTPR
jgi:antitoxin ParD1/3/4